MRRSKFYQFYHKNCNSLDARTFTDIRQRVFEIMKSEECIPEIKILFGDWMFRKIYMYFKLQEEAKTQMCGCLQTAIKNCKNIVTKGEYLKFHDYDAISLLALHFFLHRFEDQDKYFILQVLNDVQLVKNFVQNPDISDESLKNHFVKWLKTSPVLEQQSNILDVLLEYYPRDTEVVDIYRKMRWGNRRAGTLYQDEQNVHDDDIKRSVLQAAEKLLDWELNLPKKERLSVPPGTGFKDFAHGLLRDIMRTPTKKNIAKCVIARMCIDTTSFGRGFKISDLFIALFTYIKRSPSRQVLLEILIEEMDAMKELCASGYIARFMNVLQGFDDEFTITVSFEKQLYAVLTKVLSDALKNEKNEDLILGTFDEEYRPIYLKFVQRVVNRAVPELSDRYGKEDVRLSLVEVLNSLTGDNWEYSGESVQIKTLEYSNESTSTVS